MSISARSCCCPTGSAEHGFRLTVPNSTGAIVWSTPLPLAEVAFGGVVEKGVTPVWRVQAKKPWRPRTIGLDHCELLLVAGDRVLVGIQDGSSGIGIATMLDVHTGHPVGSMPPAPYHHKAIVGRGRFLVGCQGYGAFPARCMTATANRCGSGQATA